MEKLEANVAWIDGRRNGLAFGPSDRAQLENFLNNPTEAAKAPLLSHLRLQGKVRLQKRAALDKSTQDEIEADWQVLLDVVQRDMLCDMQDRNDHDGDG